MSIQRALVGEDNIRAIIGEAYDEILNLREENERLRKENARLIENITRWIRKYAEASYRR